jgi:hypothetical protein
VDSAAKRHFGPLNPDFSVEDSRDPRQQ